MTLFTCGEGPGIQENLKPSLCQSSSRPRTLRMFVPVGQELKNQAQSGRDLEIKICSFWVFLIVAVQDFNAVLNPWLCKGWQMWLLQIPGAIYLVELTPDSSGLSFLKDFLLCFIPRRHDQKHQQPQTQGQDLLLLSHLQTKEGTKPK